jgi:hypothetical protein
MIIKMKLSVLRSHRNTPVYDSDTNTISVPHGFFTIIKLPYSKQDQISMHSRLVIESLTNLPREMKYREQPRKIRSSGL